MKKISLVLMVILGLAFAPGIAFAQMSLSGFRGECTSYDGEGGFGRTEVSCGPVQHHAICDTFADMLGQGHPDREACIQGCKDTWRSEQKYLIFSCPVVLRHSKELCELYCRRNY